MRDETTTVHRYTRTGISRSDAINTYLRIIGDSKAMGLAYTPRRCFFFALPDDSDKLERAYEIRAFTEAAELRWLNDPVDGCHRAVILVERELGELDGWQEDHREVYIHSNTYLLWGAGTGRSGRPGWSELAEARVGVIPVPIAVGPEDRVQLETVEYFAEEDHGNVVVWDERLVRLRIVKGAAS